MSHEEQKCSYVVNNTILLRLETWQSTCDEAIGIVNLIGEQGVLNEDVKTRNFIVQRNPGDKKFFMIDFALCTFRREYPDETEWRRSKVMKDEEGAVGVVMQKYLTGGFVYKRSAVYENLSDDFMRE